MENKKRETVLSFEDKDGVTAVRSAGAGKELVWALSNLAALVGISTETPGRELAERLCRLWTEADALELLMEVMRQAPGKKTRVKTPEGLEKVLEQLAKDKAGADDGTAV